MKDYQMYALMAVIIFPYSQDLGLIFAGICAFEKASDLFGTKK